MGTVLECRGWADFKVDSVYCTYYLNGFSLVSLVFRLLTGFSVVNSVQTTKLNFINKVCVQTA